MSAKKAPPGAARTQTYRAAYQQLARIAAELEAGETDLDRVLPLLAEAQAAYEVCKQRIDALRAALQEGALAPGPAPGDEALEADETQDDPEDEDDDFF
ncbi:exodeoxyribonuclease VII small subunit [Deinococcus irradiatisoli]|uniref:Exodeoxyribonuclease VII small subunit n=1 Tax=Deinococcus irradiatisoli TaxID=2202254 RepID=A0A2Z3JGD9_9DEIO|nr:exodeoxyribonuclease VII small subunit [Deinococcus irradiatisoli]AWN24223.1 exodeoxyribonuclease VII small subunit [Deinococcus irradiatisoli]